MTDSGLYLELKTVALDVPPENAVRQSVEVANRIGVAVHVDVNGVLVMAYPGDDADRLVAQWKDLIRDGALPYRAAILPRY